MGETVTVTLTEFLLAQIAEDESALKDMLDGSVYVSGTVAAEDAMSRFTESSRLRADIEAKRRIVELHTPDHTWGMWCEECGETDVKWPCPTLRAVASVYADHPDYP